VYKSPSGNFSNFLKNLDNILNTWYNNKTIFVICGDANMNYLENGKKRQQLDPLLQTYNIKGTVWFPARKINGSSTAIDNIFITKTTNHTISLHINGLSDHDAQILEIENTIVKKLSNNIFIRRDINDQSIQTFNLLLSYENWEEVFMEDDANISFNKFLNIYLRIFQACFTKKCINPKIVLKPWLTKGIKISCKRKRKLYLRTRDSNEKKYKISDVWLTVHRNSVWIRKTN